jgi:hypothetical protein
MRLVNLLQRQMRRRDRQEKLTWIRANAANMEAADTASANTDVVKQPALRALRLTCLCDKFTSRE